MKNEEKKLATMICIVCGKEIDKNYAINTIGNYCKRCAVDRALNIQIDKDYASGAMDENIIFDVEKALENNQDAGCYVGDLLNIIHRLQSENKRLKKQVEQGLKDMKLEVGIRDNEIERLTEEKKTLVWLNQDLGKQVDELLAENKELKKQIEHMKCNKYSTSWRMKFFKELKEKEALQKKVDELLEERENMQAVIMRFEDMKFTKEHCDLYDENEFLKKCLQQANAQFFKDCCIR